MAVTARTLKLQRQIERDLRKITDTQTRALVSAWADAWTEIEPDLTAVLVDMLTGGDRITRAQLLRSQRLRAVLVVIARNLEDLAEQAGVRIVGDLQAVIDMAGGAQASVIDSQMPPRSGMLDDLATWSRVDDRQIAAIVRRSTEQITARTRPLSREAYQAVRRELLRGVAAGSNPRVTARRIIARVDAAGARFNGGLTRALTIARTETLSAHREAARLGRGQHTDVLGGWRWMCDLSSRTCPACLARHGTLHSADEGGPDGHQNCRCAAVPVTKSWAELGLSGLEEPEDLFPDARAWYDVQPEVTQVQIMGRERRDLLATGRVQWDQLATLRHNPGWRDSWHATSLRDLRARAAA